MYIRVIFKGKSCYRFYLEDWVWIAEDPKIELGVLILKFWNFVRRDLWISFSSNNSHDFKVKFENSYGDYFTCYIFATIVGCSNFFLQYTTNNVPNLWCICMLFLPIEIFGMFENYISKTENEKCGKEVYSLH